MFFLKLKSMLKKELLQMLRDPKMRMIVFVFPLMQLMVFSFALTVDVKNIDIAVIDYDNTRTTRELQDKFDESGYFKITKRPAGMDELKYLMDKGDVRGAVIFSKGTEEKISNGQQAEIQVIGDATMSNDAGSIFSFASGVISLYGDERYMAVKNVPVEFEIRNLFNPNLLSKNYYVPGLISMMIMVTSMLLTSIAIVREKEIGTIEQVMVTPISRFEFIIGKTLPFMLTGLITSTMMFLLANFVFGIVIKGSILLLYTLIFINILTYLGLALLVSASAKTQQQALLTSFFLMMPSALLSGYMFPVNNMPLPVQYFTHLVPMRWGLEGIIGIVVKGATLKEMAEPLIWLCIHAAFFLGIASVKFKKTLE